MQRAAPFADLRLLAEVNEFVYQRAELRAAQLAWLQRVNLIPKAEPDDVQGLQHWEVQGCQIVIGHKGVTKMQQL